MLQIHGASFTVHMLHATDPQCFIHSSHATRYRSTVLHSQFTCYTLRINSASFTVHMLHAPDPQCFIHSSHATCFRSTVLLPYQHSQHIFPLFLLWLAWSMLIISTNDWSTAFKLYQLVASNSSKANTYVYTPCLKINDTRVAHYNFNTHQPIWVILGRDVAERVCYQMVICYSTSPN